MEREKLTQGKGSKRRPKFITDKQLEENWALAFNIKNKIQPDSKVENLPIEVKEPSGLEKQNYKDN